MNNLFHFIWLGGEISRDDSDRIAMWSVIGDVNLVTEIPACLKDLSDKAQSLHAKSDLLRYWLVYEYGGTYLDTDCIPGNEKFEQPTGPYAAGYVASCGELKWSNFVVGSDIPKDPFWELTLERCANGQRSDTVACDPCDEVLFLYNIEYIWGIEPIIQTVLCRQGDYYKCDHYMIHHLARTNPDDIIKRPPNLPQPEQKKQHPLTKMLIKCKECPDFIQKKFCVAKRSYMVQECERWNNPRGRYVRPE